MSIKKFRFRGETITFGLSTDNRTMVHATALAKVFNKEVYDFLRCDSTKQFIRTYCEILGLRYENEMTPNGILVKVNRGGCHNGTWMERSVALKFLAWLDPDFEIWIYKTKEDTLFNKKLIKTNAQYQNVLKQQIRDFKEQFIQFEHLLKQTEINH